MTQRLPEAFAFCPKCGRASESVGKNPFYCSGCAFKFFFGPTVAVGAIVTDEVGRVLFLERARDPGKGKLGIPGGFVDAGETLEQALAREVFEETNLKVTSSRYLTTFPNVYPYLGILYPVTDVFYECHVDGYDSIVVQEGEVDSYSFCDVGHKELESMAFESNRLAIEFFLSHRAPSINHMDASR
jgi:ADP-ribose pyrophosphatase YjhB (NUDIX family)